MRRLGTILMILGVNMAVGSVAAAFWMASMECAIQAVDGGCPEGAIKLFITLMTSSDGIVFWIVIALGLVVFWRGKKMRTNAT